MQPLNLPMKLSRLHIALALLIGTLVPMSGAVAGSSKATASFLLAQQSNSAALQEAVRLIEQAFELYQQARYDEAEPLFQQALQTSEQALGKTHPLVASSLTGLALIYHDQGNYSAAEPLYRRALQIVEQGFGSTHPYMATSLNNLAALYQEQGNSEKALPLITRQLNIEEANLIDALSVGSSSRKQMYAETLRGSTFQILSYTQYAPQSTEFIHLALETILRRKGRVLDVLVASNQQLRQNLTDEDQILLEQLQSQQSSLDNLLFSPPEQANTEQYREKVDSLRQQIDEIENILARRNTEFRLAVEPVTVEDVQAQIPQDAALIEIFQYTPLSLENGAWNPPRYVAYTLTAQGDRTPVDLGESAVIDEKVAELNRAIVQPHLHQQTRALTRELDAMLVEPIRAQIGDVEHLLISPDGQLNLLPFTALVDENDRYLPD